MGGKSNGGGGQVIWGIWWGGFANVVQDPPAPTATATSGATEPAWPTSEGAQVADGGVVWTAILARVWKGGVVTGVLNRSTFQFNSSPYPSHYFQYGKIKFLTGLNAGAVYDVRDHLASVEGNPPYFMLLEVAANPIQVGDTFEATIGCPKIRNACQKFNNIDNFRGFPDMPTEERALATPNVSNQGYAPKQTK
jgi:uncharacterized phage protein (TIGR02218 family)